MSQALCAAGFGAELPWSPLRGDWLSTAPDLPQPQCSGQCQSQLCLSDHSTADLCPCCLRGAAGTALGVSVPLPPEREGKGLQKFLGHLRQGFESFRVWCQERLTQGSRRNAQLLSSGGRVGVVLKSQPGGFGLLQTPGFLGFLLCSFLCLEQEGEVVPLFVGVCARACSEEGMEVWRKSPCAPLSSQQLCCVPPLSRAGSGCASWVLEGISQLTSGFWLLCAEWLPLSSCTGRMSSKYNLKKA